MIWKLRNRPDLSIRAALVEHPKATTVPWTTRSTPMVPPDICAAWTSMASSCRTLRPSNRTSAMAQFSWGSHDLMGTGYLFRQRQSHICGQLRNFKIGILQQLCYWIQEESSNLKQLSYRQRVCTLWKTPQSLTFTRCMLLPKLSRESKGADALLNDWRSPLFWWVHHRYTATSGSVGGLGLDHVYDTYEYIWDV